jgi:hypothetical protein
MDFSRPGFRDPLDFLASDRLKFPLLSTYIPALDSRFRDSAIGYALSRASLIVEPTDRTLGKAARLSKGSAFYCGGLIGVRILDSCTPESVRAAALELISLPEVDDPLTDGDYYADQLVDNSERGLTLLPSVAEVITSWETDYTQDITIQPFFVRGAGLLLYAMHQANEVVLGSEMKQALEDPSKINWDAELLGLIGDDPS